MIEPDNFRKGNHPNPFLQYELNDHDREMIEKAKKLPSMDWYEVNKQGAETVEGYDELHWIECHLYHLDEASCGLL